MKLPSTRFFELTLVLVLHFFFVFSQSVSKFALNERFGAFGSMKITFHGAERGKMQ